MKTVKIKGMSCHHCIRAVQKALDKMEGVGNVSVDLSKGEAVLEEAGPIDMQAVRDRIAKAGYEVVE